MGWFLCVCVLYCIPTAVGQDFELIVFFSNSFSPSLPSLPPLSFPLSLIYTLIQSFWFCSSNMTSTIKTSCMWSLLSLIYMHMYSTPSLSTVYLSHTFPFLSFSLYIITPKSLHSIILYTHTHAHILSLSLYLFDFNPDMFHSSHTCQPETVTSNVMGCHTLYLISTS